MVTSSSKKRDRNANFSSIETETLVSLIESRKHIIENKKSNAIVWQDKEKAWKAIELDFNSDGGKVYRDAKNLKVKYESKKRDVRKKMITQDRSGSSKSSAVCLTPIDLRVQEIMSTSVKEDSDCESDQLFNPDSNNFAVEIEKVNVEESQFPMQRGPVEDILTPGIAISDAKAQQKKGNDWQPNMLMFEEGPALDDNCMVKERKTTFGVIVEDKKDLVSLQKHLIGEEIQEKVLRKILVREEIEHKREMYKLEKEEILLKIELLKNALQNANQK